MRDLTLDPHRLLVLCTRNSARSQIAEALLQTATQSRVVAASAGSAPGPGVHPLAVAVLAEIGIDWQGRHSQGIDAVADAPWDAVITVCDAARDACPYLPTAGLTAHWGLEDPAAVGGPPDVQLAAFRATREQLHSAITAFLAIASGISPHDTLALRDALNAGAGALLEARALHPSS